MMFPQLAIINTFGEDINDIDEDCVDNNDEDEDLVDADAVVDERQKSQIEKRKRNLKTISPISRGGREI